ncbi:MAG: AraC family transcriptional regulator [Luteitalea sp.]|nr:AraC family transcriptional regulator [Luteitalea sp.]
MAVRTVWVRRLDGTTNQTLLRETGLTIAEIASEVGFSDQSYFDKRFKRAFGLSPREFRLGLSGQNPPRI